MGVREHAQWSIPVGSVLRWWRHGRCIENRTVLAREHIFVLAFEVIDWQSTFESVLHNASNHSQCLLHGGRGEKWRLLPGIYSDRNHGKQELAA